MEKVDVSVCVATYNQENYIRQALDSIFMQRTNFNFEVIVGEDSSPDNTRQILLEYKEKYGDKLVLLLHEKNLGPSGNTRSIHEKVRGRYIAFLEGDDYWTDEYKLQKQYDVLENNPQYSAVCSDFMHVDPEGNTIKESVLNMKKSVVKTMKDWMKYGYSLHTCTIFRRNIFPETDEKYIKLVTAEPTMGDLISFTLLYDAGDICVLKDVMSAHRMAGENDASSFAYKNKTQSIKYTHMFIRIMHNLEEYLDHKYDFSPRICNRIAGVKFGKIFGGLKYKSSEMREITKHLPLKMKINIYYRLTRMIVRKIVKRIKLYCSKLRSLYAR